MSADAFEELAASFRGGDWYAAWMEARQAVKHLAAGNGYSVAGIGWIAWNELNPDQRRDALNGFFTDYFLTIAEEERAEQLQEHARAGNTYLDGWEPGSLTTSLAEAQAAGQALTEDGEVTVSALALSNVLGELELVQHRLKMIIAEQESKP